MDKLKILAIGTKESLKKARGLQEDCRRFRYQFESITLKEHKHISHSQFETVDNIVRYFNKSWQEEKICVIHPESRILQPVPQDWIDSNLPVLFKQRSLVDEVVERRNGVYETRRCLSIK